MEKSPADRADMWDAMSRSCLRAGTRDVHNGELARGHIGMGARASRLHANIRLYGRRGANLATMRDFSSEEVLQGLI